MITEFEWNHHFADIQKKGPFKQFQHRHELSAETQNNVEGTIVRDVIEYDPGFGLLGQSGAESFYRTQPEANFRVPAEDTGKIARLTKVW